MIWRLRIFGYEVASLERDDEPEPYGITGGSTMLFERDENPYSSDERYDWEPEDNRGFGFS